MKILQLCKKFPFPVKDGEVIAINYLAKAMDGMGCEVTLLCMNTPKHYFQKSDLPAHYNHYKDIHVIDVDTDVKPWDAFKNLFSSSSYNIQRFVSANFNQQLISMLSENHFDIVQLETLYLAPYISTIRQHSKALIALRAHNVEHEIWSRIAANTSFLPKKWYLQHLTKKLKAFEVEAVNQCDILVPITSRDLVKFQSFGFNKKAAVTPIGLDKNDYQANYSSYKNDLSISFIGSMDWMPNLEGMKWFLDKVWAKAKIKYPNLKLHIAGRNTPDWMLQMNEPSIIIHGEIPDAQEFINAHSIMVVPLLSGSGMRAKILEGMALGKVVLTTSIGLEGIDARHHQEVLVADDANAFLECIQYCHQSNGDFQSIGERAQKLIEEKYDNASIVKALTQVYQSEQVASQV